MSDKFIPNDEAFLPFGLEWEAEMMKLPKKALIDMLRETFQTVTRLEGKKTKEETVEKVLGKTRGWSIDIGNESEVERLREEVEALTKACDVWKKKYTELASKKFNDLHDEA